MDHAASPGRNERTTRPVRQIPKYHMHRSICNRTTKQYTKIKIRDWAKAAKQLKPEEKTWNKPQNRIGQPATIAQIIA